MAYISGKLQLAEALDGTKILPELVLPRDVDDDDLTQCAQPKDRPWLSCFNTGDGMRGNQQPLISAMTIILIVRHNQHCDRLSEVNPHWTDETLYLEARYSIVLV